MFPPFSTLENEPKAQLDLTRSPINFVQSWRVLACFFRHARWDACWHVLSFRAQIS